MVNMQQEIDEVITRESNVVYPVDFITEEYCSTFDTFSMTDFTACMTYAQTELIIGYVSLILGLLIGFILAKAVADGWV